MLRKDVIEKLEELVERQEDPNFGWCCLEDRTWLHQAVQSLPEDALIVEIGTFKGKATAVMVLASLDTKRRIITVDPHVEYLHHFGKPASLVLGIKQSWDEIHQEFLDLFKDVPFVKHIRERSDVAERHFKPSSIDMVWIDGLHTEIAVETDLKLWHPLVKSGGIVSGHDWRSGSVRKGIANYIEGKVIKVTNVGNCWSFIKV